MAQNNSAPGRVQLAVRPGPKRPGGERPAPSEASHRAWIGGLRHEMPVTR